MTARLQSLCSRHVLPLRLTAAMLATLSFTSLASAETGLATPKLAGHEAVAPAGVPGLTEERSFITVRIGGAAYHLDMLVVKPALAEGRLPVALIAHGKPPGFAMPMLRPDDYLPQARDLAYRGYLSAVVIRRGYGRSDGTAGVGSLAPYAGCETPD